MTHDTETPALSGGPVPAPPPAPPAEPLLPPKRLRRSRADRVLGGVCGGLAEYFGVDVVLLRIVAVALALSGGAGFVLYVIAWIVVPEGDTGPAGPGATAAQAGPREDETSRARSRTTAVTIMGAALVAIGALMLLNRVLPWLDAALVWPIVLVAAGVSILTSGRRSS